MKRDIVCLGSFSAEQPLSFDINPTSLGSDDLQPCIEDIRLEIDRLRREEQLLRERLADERVARSMIEPFGF